ncbi:hypothetical protein AVEN_29144-1 [Araneus ventricosus]|uniref:DUF4817 domain-containing protein n=1 Tax=Araneus ventricosus TaxID=182803 RepID=A0A4Y2ALP6_ARAVE|nr:hypothetical protein AVEN_29144-1 [Araneus ventricosus]
MASIEQKAQCVVWFHETKSRINVQRAFRCCYGCNPLDTKSIKRWYEKFKETGSVTDLPDLQPNDCPRRAKFAIEILNRIDVENDYLNRICFSDESIFHVSGMVNRHNVRIWGSENPHVSAHLQRDSPKVNVWCGLMHNKVIGPFFFTEKSITANVYLDLLRLFIAPQFDEFQPWTMFQHDGSRRHWGSLVRDFLDETFPDRWIGRDGPTPWPPRSPDITPLDFFLLGLHQGQSLCHTNY